jgi:hypothetical protein
LRPPPRLIARIALVVAPLALLWAGRLFFFGGFHVAMFGGTLTAHDLWRPLVVALAATVLYVWLTGVAEVRGQIAQVFRSLERAVAWVDARVLAATIAAAVVAAGIMWMSLAVGGSDSYGYASEAEMWRRGDLVIAQPWTAAVPWPDADRTFAPLGYHSGPQPHTIAPTYSPGLPILMALAKTVGGQCGMFFVVPISAGIAVLATFGLGTRLATPAAGLAAAWLLATSPVFLFMLMSPMSDVPTAAAWVVAFWCATGRSVSSAAGCGVATAIAVLLRPNLAPMALLAPGWQLLMARRSDGDDRRRQIWRGLAMLLVVAPAFATVAWLNQLWYGSPLRAGYGALGDLFAWSNIKPNIVNYATWFSSTQTPAAFAGIAALLVPFRWIWSDRGRSFVIVVAIFVMTVWLEYCAYLVFDAWWYLRFLLPCWPFIMVGMGALAVGVARWLRPVVGVAATAAVVGLGAFGLQRAIRDDFGGLRRGENKYPVVAEILRAHTDRTAVILSGMHSGSARYYGGRMTMTFFQLDRDWLDRAVAWLAAHGSHPYALLEDWEVDEFRTRFGPTNAIGRLEMPPMIEYGAGSIYVFDLLRANDSREPIVRLEEPAPSFTCRPPGPPPPAPRFRE